LREAIASVDPNLPIISTRNLREQVAGQFNQQRLIARLTSFFGVLSLVLASIGLYGLLSTTPDSVSEKLLCAWRSAERGDIVTLG